jgi:hypothetical protein
MVLPVIKVIFESLTSTVFEQSTSPLPVVSITSIIFLFPSGVLIKPSDKGSTPVSNIATIISFPLYLVFSIKSNACVSVFGRIP